MSRPSRIPSYRLHKQSGQAIVTLTDTLGGRRDVLLGAYDTPESRTEYARIIGEWEARGRRLYDQADEEPGALSVNELMAAFLEHAEQHYRREDGTHTSELRDYKLSNRPLRELYGTLAVADFGPLKLKAVRQKMIGAGLSRGVVNQRIGRIVRAFKWGVAEEIVSESVWRSLTTVRGLEKGRTEARETEAVLPVAVEIAAATLPYLLPPVRAMVELQLVSGMRPGEVRIMRACDLDRSGVVWTYRPAHHKTRHKGKERVVAIGPRGQGIIKPFLKLDTQAYLFSPRDALAWRWQEQRRHTHATTVRRQFGLEAAQVALGHSQAQITEVYAERDLALAAKVAQQIAVDGQGPASTVESRTVRVHRMTSDHRSAWE